MALRKSLACTFGLTVALVAASCADSKPLTPTLPSATGATSNSDGSVLKASSPTPQSPVSGTEVSLRPTLTVSNASGREVDLPLTYIFQLFEGDTLVRQTDSIAIGSENSTWQVPGDLLKYETTYRWRAKALYNGIDGPWSGVETFRTQARPIVNPTDGSSGPRGPVACAGTSGPEIIACVAARFPERLVPTSNGDFSDERRFANMEFLRDRIIETGKCAGINLGLNRKRGTEVISRDFIVLRGNSGKNGMDRGVDIASGYDATRDKLKLTWQVFDGSKSGGHPFYKDYGPVDCSAVQ